MRLRVPPALNCFLPLSERRASAMPQYFADRSEGMRGCRGRRRRACTALASACRLRPDLVRQPAILRPHRRPCSFHAARLALRSVNATPYTRVMLTSVRTVSSRLLQVQSLGVRFGAEQFPQPLVETITLRRDPTIPEHLRKPWKSSAS